MPEGGPCPLEERHHADDQERRALLARGDHVLVVGYNLMYPLGDWAIEGYFSGLFPSWGVMEAVYLADQGLAAADDASYASTGRTSSSS